MKNPKPEMFRQKGPTDELIALVASALGDLSNADFSVQVGRAECTLRYALDLLRKMPSRKWDKA